MPDPLPSASLPWLVERAQRDPGALALHDGARALSYGQLAARVDCLAGRLAALGLSRGDRVAVLMEASSRLVELAHAMQRCGATLVPLNTRLSPAEIAVLVADAEPRLLLYDRERAADLEETRACVRSLQVVEATDEIDAVPPILAPAPRQLDHAAVLTILYTSGTTGRPRGVMLTNGNHFASAAASRANLGALPEDRWLVVLPLYHVGGLSIVFRSVLDGAAILLQPRFDPVHAAAALREDGVTLLSLVPTMLLRLLEHAGDRAFPPSLRCVLVGGGPARPALLARARAVGMPVAPTYGLTEAASQVATAAVSDTVDRPEGVGRALPGTRLRISESDANGCGEILVQGPTVMAGYFRQPDATRKALGGGWLHTGDVGRLDAGGFLYVLDRRTDLIVSGGENVYPAEVETVLLAHPEVLEAAVYALPDPEWGQRVAAAVIPRAECTANVENIRAWCKERLAGYKVPRVIEHVTALPRTASGKVRRHLLAAGATARPHGR
jgi:O-succinylbenzoic acid--CoA ligase